MSTRQLTGIQNPPRQQPTTRIGLSGNTHNVANPSTSRYGVGAISHADSPSLQLVEISNGHHGTDGSSSTAPMSSNIKSEPQSFKEEDLRQSLEFPVRPGDSEAHKRLILPVLNHPRISQKPTTAIGTAAESRRQNVEVPEDAMVYQGSPGNNIAGFSPWNGRGLEDTMSEQTSKTGFLNKPLVTNESNTARPQLWSHLKNKGGVSTLSSLFVSLMDKRQLGGRMADSSTFKPPPRVAMSNSRREAYLGELADPSIPMRKLNRSVPHTISGRVLLDQCLTKKIPIPRAVWLAKCIGANDFRAFKRKSATGVATMGSELKWTKDWTIHVEQFLKCVVMNVGEPQWKSDIDYAIRLSSHLSSEHLLDEDHFLQWLLSSLEESTSQHLPVWTLLTQIYWASLTATRKRGSRLAQALLVHLVQLLGEMCDDILHPIISKLENMVAVLAVSHGDCLVMPRCWQRFATCIQSISDKASNPQVSSAIDKVVKRNNRLTLTKTTKNGGSNLKARLVHLLDEFSLTITANELAERCFDINLPQLDLLRMILRWASTKYRVGWYRRYIAVRLIREMYLKYDDMDALLWQVARLLSTDETLDTHAFYQVYIELVRSCHFSLGRFVQHLISIGAHGEREDVEILQLLSLLHNLPSGNQSDSAANMRFELLESSGFNPAKEEQITQQAIQEISAQLVACGSATNLELMDMKFFKGFSACQKQEIAYFLRQNVLDMVGTACRNNIDPFEDVKHCENFFFLVRNILEEFQEFACLVDVVGTLLDVENQTLLTSVTVTLNYGHKCIEALGVMKHVFDKLIKVYQSLRGRQALNRSFCAAILDLAHTLEVEPMLISQLTQDLLRCEQSYNIAMCSPASDSIGDMMQMSSVGCDDEIDRILSSGTIMDPTMIGRVFSRIAGRMEEAFKLAITLQLPFGSWLARLRSFEHATFDTILHEYLAARMVDIDALDMLYDFIVPTLSGSSCMTIAEYATLVQNSKLLFGASGRHLQLESTIRLLDMLLPNTNLEPLCAINDAYKYRLDRNIFAAAFPDTIFELLKMILEVPIGSSARVRNTLSSPRLCSFLLETLTQSDTRRTDFSNLLRSIAPGHTENVRLVIDCLVQFKQSNDLREPSLNIRIHQIFSTLDELSAAFGSLALDVLHEDLHLESSTTSSDVGREQLSISIVQAIVENATSSLGVSCEVLPSLSSDLKRSLATLVEHYILAMPLPSEDSTVEIDHSDAQTYLEILEWTAQSSSSSHELTSLTEYIEKSRIGLDTLSSETLVHNSSKTISEDSIAKWIDWIEIILRLVVIRKQLSASAKVQPDATLCLHLLILMQTPQILLYPETSTFIFDTAAILTDELSDDQVACLIKMDCLQTSDYRLNFLLGQSTSSALDAWLGIVLSQHASAHITGSAATGTHSGTSIVKNLTQTQSPQASSRTPQNAQGSRALPQTPNITKPSNQQGSTNTSKSFLPPTQFPLKHWELLFDQGNTAPANDTAISLAMFGMRKA